MISPLAVVFLLGQFGCSGIDQRWEEHRRGQKEASLMDRDGPEAYRAGPSPVGSPAGVPVTARATPTRPLGGMAPVVVEDSFDQATILPPDPIDFGADAPGSFAPFPEPLPIPSGTPYTVQRGDSLWSISQKFNVPFVVLMEANGMNRETRLRVGQEIRIPEGYERSTVAKTSAPAATAAPAENTRSYTVRAGDTLSGIALRHRATVSEIRRLNGLQGDLIRVGQTLQVPDRGPPAAAPVARTTQVAPVPSADVGTAAEGFDLSRYTATHRVSEGENIAMIARRYGMASRELMAVNNIDNPRNLPVGATLRVLPAGGAGPSKIDAARPVTPAPETRPAPRPEAPSIVAPPVEEDFGFDEDALIEGFDTIIEVPAERREP